MVKNRKISVLAIILLIFAFVITSVIISLGYNNALNVNAYTAGTTPASIGELTLSGYESRTDGQVFNPAMLNALYAKIMGDSTATYDDVVKAVQESKSTLTGKNSTVDTQLYSMNYQKIIQASNAPITVTFGGYTWNVVYLTTNTVGSTDGDGDLIATLWMSETDTAIGNVQWNSYSSTSTAVTDYSSNNYSLSMIRMKTLNGGSSSYTDTTYATSTSSLGGTVSAVDRANNAYAKFTMSNAALTSAGQNGSGNNLSLIDFLATPSQVLYQEKESFTWSYGTNAHFNVSEAWGTPSVGSWYGTMGNVAQQYNYIDWANDYIWLPSMTETGFYTNNSATCISLWGVNNITLLKSSASIWTRSGFQQGAGNTQYVSNVAGGGNSAVTSTLAVRPALHLNLTAAQNNVELKVPSNVTKVYNGSEQGIEDLSWYTDTFKNACTVTYYQDNVPMTSSKPKLAGTYSVKFSIKSGSLRVWSDGTTTDKTITFTISKKPIDFPSVDGSNSDVYSGDTPVKFYINNYDSSQMDINIPSKFTGLVTTKLTGGDPYVDALGVGKYELEVTLKDTNNYTWKTDDDDEDEPKFEFEVTKAPIKMSIYDTAGGSLNYVLSGAQGATIGAYLEIETGNIHTGKSVTALIMAYRNSIVEGQGTQIGQIDLDDSSTIESISLDLTELRKDTQYILGVEIAGKDYTASSVMPDGDNYQAVITKTTTLDVSDPSLHNTITWRLTANGNIVVNQTEYSELTDITKTFGGTIVYDGKKYGFIVSVPNGYTLDTNYGIDGYEVVPQTNGNPNPCIDADTYKISIRIEEDSTGKKTEYYLEWTIQKAKFDFTNVKWLNDGKVEYNDGADVSPEIDSSTLPDGLVPHYSGSTVGNSVIDHDGGKVTVTFTLASGYEDNYELPVNGGKGTNYTFTGDGDFEWEKIWEVVPAVLKLEWEDKQVTDSNGNVFNVLVLKDTRANGKVDYLYYPTNNLGVIDTTKQPLTEEDILVSATDRQYFVAYPTIKSGYADNYTFPDNVAADKRYSDLFSVGGGSASVTVSLSTDKYEYNNGKPVSLKIDIVGAATMNNLTLTYYNGDVVDDANKLNGAPINVGKYLVVIKSNTPTVVLSGTTQYEFEITQSRVSTTWKTEAKPPVLDLKYGQINGVEYEIYDSLGNLITDISDIVPGDYKIRAKISDTQNYIFDDDTYETEFVDFTIREGDEIYDPNDSSNPFYPQEDPDNPNPGEDGDGGGSVLDKIKEFFDKLIESHFPLWQVITMAVSALLALIFMIKAIQYGNRAKKAKGEAKKLSARAYATFLPIFSGEVVALGLTNKIWSIMAFAFVGLALLMFLIALITRHSWKKAELAKEAAISEAGFIAKNGNQLATVNGDNGVALIAEMNRQLQETLAQVSNNGQANAANGGDLSSFEEILRRRDEEHRREMEEREERYRRDEEARRREDEERHRQEMDTMKMMLANMMGRQQGDEGFAYASLDDTDMLVQRVIAGLLPAVQQMMPEATAYLAAPQEQNEELIALVEEQKAIMEEQSEEIRNMSEAHSEEMRAMSEQMNELQEQLAAMTQDRADAVILSDNGDDIMAEMSALREQIANLGNQSVTVAADPNANSEVLAKMNEMQQQIAALSAGNTTTVYVEREADEDNDSDDDEEEWDSVLDEDDDDFIEAVVIDDDGTVRKASPNFRMRLKQSSDKNREWYAAIKNLFCSQKNITYRVYKRVEKIRYQGNVIAVIGIAKRSIKLWLALKPFEYDARRYHHKDVSDKPRFVDVPLYVRVGSDRALTRAQELILALFQEQATEPRKRYTDRDIQELIFTLKYNKLLTKQNKGLLREVMHVHDCDVLDNETAEKCIESKNVEYIDDSVIETVKLDDIDMHFQDGNRVTVDKLRKLGLVSAECTGYNVVAGHRLTKPLIIVANDFTMEAVKMIALTGGRVIKLKRVSK